MFIIPFAELITNREKIRFYSCHYSFNLIIIFFLLISTNQIMSFLLSRSAPFLNIVNLVESRPYLACFVLKKPKWQDPKWKARFSQTKVGGAAHQSASTWHAKGPSFLFLLHLLRTCVSFSTLWKFVKVKYGPNANLNSFSSLTEISKRKKQENF